MAVGKTHLIGVCVPTPYGSYKTGSARYFRVRGCVTLGPVNRRNVSITLKISEPMQWNTGPISGTLQPVEKTPGNFDPKALAVQYYFGDLQYWKLPGICIEALEHGFDGCALRRLSGLMNPVQRDIRQEEIDAAFREMGVDAPIPKDEARLVLATDAAKRALAGETNIFNEATHIRIHLCGLHEAPPELQHIVALADRSDHAPSWQWGRLERQLSVAMTQFLQTRK